MEGLGKWVILELLLVLRAAGHYWSPVDLMSYFFVNFATFLISTERKCHIHDLIVFKKSTLTQSERISGRCAVTFFNQTSDIFDQCVVSFERF